MYDFFLVVIEATDETPYDILLIPDFKQPIRSFEEFAEYKSHSNRELHVTSTIHCGPNNLEIKTKFSSDKTLRITGNSVYASENATWVIEESEFATQVFLTTKTCKIQTPFGADYDTKLNQLVCKARKEYLRKKNDVRLYFYNRRKDRLFISSEPAYPTAFGIIDRDFEKPTTDCFILGRIKKSSGTKKGQLIDFIEPIYKIPLDFSEDDHFSYDESYKDLVDDLETKLLFLLSFTREPNNSRAVTDSIRRAFKESDIASLRKLYNSINNT